MGTSRISGIAIGVFAIGVFALAGLFMATHGVKAAGGAPIPAATSDDSLAPKPSKEVAVFAGGCFWGTQSVFERVKGVVETTVGYSGGSASTATYEQVGTETTGHAESVRVSTIHRGSPMGNCCASFSRSRTIRPSSIARVPMWVRRTAR